VLGVGSVSLLRVVRRRALWDNCTTDHMPVGRAMEQFYISFLSVLQDYWPSFSRLEGMDMGWIF
jgi:hypothetical protein